VTHIAEEDTRKAALSPSACSGGQSSSDRQAGAAQTLERRLLGGELSWLLLPTDLLGNQRFGVRPQSELAQSGWKAGKSASC